MVGIDISDRSIKIVELTDGDAPKLQTVGWAPLQANLMRRGVILDIPAVTAALQGAMMKCSPHPITKGRAVLSIPETQSFVRVLELPVMSETEMDEAVQWAIRQHIPFDLDRVYLDWQPLPGLPTKAGHQQVLVGAAQRDVINPLLQVVDSLQLEVIALELEAQAIVRSLLPRDSQDIRGVLLVDLGATSTNIIFFDQGTMRFTTSLQRGGDDLTQQLAQELQLQPSIAAEEKALIGVNQTADTNAAVAQTLRAATVAQVQQISQQVREFMATLPEATPLRAVLLAGGTANLPGLSSVFNEVFAGVPVQVGNPWINLVVSDGKDTNQILAPTDATHFTTAIGLALRQPDYA